MFIVKNDNGPSIATNYDDDESRSNVTKYSTIL